MQSRLLLNIVLLALVIALSLIVYNSADESADKITLLTRLSPETVTDIHIHHNQRKTELHKQGDRWIMTQPIRIDANDFRINTLLKLTGATSYADYDVNGLDLSQYGLKQPATLVRLNDVEIAFGTSNPVNGKRYVRIGERMHQIDDSIYPLLSSQTGALVARELLPKGASVSILVLPGVTLSRNPDGSWHSDGDTSAESIGRTVESWKHAQAFAVHNYMKRDMLAKIEVYFAGETTPLQFVVTDTDPWLIIARPALGLEYHFNLEYYDSLLRPGADETPVPADVPAELTKDIVRKIPATGNSAD